MAESLLISIRNRLLAGDDLSELLRACIFLSHDTDSQSLQSWATRELTGYTENGTLPQYRVLENYPLTATIRNGHQLTSGALLTPFHFPERARKLIPEKVFLPQPIKELEAYSRREGTISMVPGALTYARDIYNHENNPFNEIVELTVNLNKSFYIGLVDQVRTSLTSMIADLTSETQLNELPTSEKVDNTVYKYIHTNYEASVSDTKGPVAIGTEATANQSGLSIDELLRVIDAFDLSRYDLATDARHEAQNELDLVRDEVRKGAPDEGRVRTILERLKGIAQSTGDALFSGAVETVSSTIVSTLI